MSSADKLIIETPEQTLLDFPLAGVGSRFLAIAVDTVLQGLIVALVVTALIFILPAFRFVSSYGVQWILALAILGIFVINTGYFAFFESIWNGQTPGKRMARIRVVKDDGRPIGVYDAVSRNLLRTVDQLPAMYGIGVVSILFSRQGKRLGDHVAGTVVIHERSLEGMRPFVETAVDSAEPVYDTSRLAPEEFQLIEAFFSRCDSFEPTLRTSMSAQIARRIGAKLGVEVRGWPRTEIFLAEVLKQYRTTGHLGGRGGALSG